jgi:hypothetical protein
MHKSEITIDPWRDNANELTKRTTIHYRRDGQPEVSMDVTVTDLEFGDFDIFSQKMHIWIELLKQRAEGETKQDETPRPPGLQWLRPSAGR